MTSLTLLSAGIKGRHDAPAFNRPIRQSCPLQLLRLWQTSLLCGDNDIVEEPFPWPLRCRLPFIIELECRLHTGAQRREELSVPLHTVGALELGEPQVHDKLWLAYPSPQFFH